MFKPAFLLAASVLPYLAEAAPPFVGGGAHIGYAGYGTGAAFAAPIAPIAGAGYVDAIYKRDLEDEYEDDEVEVAGGKKLANNNNNAAKQTDFQNNKAAVSIKSFSNLYVHLLITLHRKERQKCPFGHQRQHPQQAEHQSQPGVREELC